MLSVMLLVGTSSVVLDLGIVLLHGGRGRGTGGRGNNEVHRLGIVLLHGGRGRGTGGNTEVHRLGIVLLYSGRGGGGGALRCEGGDLGEATTRDGLVPAGR